MQSQVVFEVGEIYANRNGRYRVEELQVGGHVMRISYLDSGEEQITPVALQQRISRNMGWERREARVRAKQEERRYLSSYGKDFKGLDPADFKREIVGTRWRRRGELPGAVAKKLSLGQRAFTFTSGALARRPVAYLIHREKYDDRGSDDADTSTRFSIEVDEANIYYGLVIESRAALKDEEWDWPRLIETLRVDETVREAFAAAVETYGARLIGRVIQDGEDTYYADGGEALENLWNRDDAAGMSIDEQLAQIGQVAKDSRAEVFIIVQQPKEDAVAAKTKIADQIAALMNTLLPMYAAAVV